MTHELGVTVLFSSMSIACMMLKIIHLYTDPKVKFVKNCVFASCLCRWHIYTYIHVWLPTQSFIDDVILCTVLYVFCDLVNNIMLAGVHLIFMLY